MKNIFITIGVLILLAAVLPSCKPKDPGCDNCENELITTLDVALTDSATGITGHFIFRDLDGDGSNAPVRFDTIHLLPNHTYNASLIILDESKNPADTISNEILEEADDHAFFFHPNPAESISVIYLDQDANALPIGLLTRWYAGAAVNGTLKIVLRHQPGLKNGTETPGETDLDVTFKTMNQ
jgi:hypothetical protein